MKNIDNLLKIKYNEIKVPDYMFNMDRVYNRNEVKNMPTKASVNQAKYDKDNTTNYHLKLNNKTDKDIIALIEKVMAEQNVTKQGAIKYLIRKSGN